LFEASVLAGIKISSISDLNLIRNEKIIHTFEHPNFENTTFKEIPVLNWTTLILHGNTNTGKTMWACHQFKSPCVCSHIDDLGNFKSSIHDGIVFDDMSFNHYPREAVIHILDWELDRSIQVRYKCAFIPKHTRKIFTTNKTLFDFLPFDDSGAIKRRYKSFHVTEKLFDYIIPSTTNTQENSDNNLTFFLN